MSDKIAINSSKEAFSGGLGSKDDEDVHVDIEGSRLDESVISLFSIFCHVLPVLLPTPSLQVRHTFQVDALL